MSHNWIDSIAWTSRVAPFQLVVVAVSAWLHREQTDLIAFLREENRVLKSRLGGRRLRFEDHERRRIYAALADEPVAEIVLCCEPKPCEACCLSPHGSSPRSM